MAPSMHFELRPIGVVHGGRTEVTDDRWGDVKAVLAFDPDLVPAEATRGLDAFSHLEVVYGFHLIDEPPTVTGDRRPRGREDWPLGGGLAQRNKARVNRLGVSRCGIETVDQLQVHVVGLDAVAGSPVFDIKPWMNEFGPLGGVHQPGWATELMRDYYAGQPEG